MTVPSTIRKAGPYNGNDVATSFAFSFKVFTTADIAVTVADVDGAESLLVLDSDYSVTLNGDQDASPGGSITYPLSGAPLATGEALVVVGDLDYGQDYDVPTGGNFNPTAMEDALDKQAMRTQQLLEINSRSMTLAVTSADDVSTSLPVPEARGVLGWNAAANALINYAGVAGVAVSPFMEAVVAAADAAAARLQLLAAKSGANTDITSLSAPALGAATATTQPATDSSTKVATTAMAQSVGFKAATIVGISASTTLVAADAGKHFVLNGAGVFTVTMPVPATVIGGGGFSFENTSGFPVTLQRQTSGAFNAFGLTGGTSLVLLPGDTVGLFTNTADWYQSYGYQKQLALAQFVTATLNTLATGTTLVPTDDTIPQITEGDQYLTIDITPKNANSTLEIDIEMMVGSSVVGAWASMMLFVDAVANALASKNFYLDTASASYPISLKHVVAAGSTSPRTYRVRAGAHVAGTLNINGAAGIRLHGGVQVSRITVKEYLP